MVLAIVVLVLIAFSLGLYVGGKDYEKVRAEVSKEYAKGIEVIQETLKKVVEERDRLKALVEEAKQKI